VAALFTTQKLAPPIRAAASAQPATNRATSRLIEIGRAADELLTCRGLEREEIRGSRSVREPSIGPVCAP
jgi:hypothetical protein